MGTVDAMVIRVEEGRERGQFQVVREVVLLRLEEKQSLAVH